MAENKRELAYFGKNINELSKEQLIIAIHDLFDEMEHYRKMYEKSQQSVITLMGDCRKLKFGQ